MVAHLVIKFGQQLDQAWRFTLREYMMVADFRSEINRGKNVWDADKLVGLEKHLRKIGAIDG